MDCRHSPWGNRSRHRQQGSDKGLLSPRRGNRSQHFEPSTSAAAARPCSRLNSFHMEPGVGCCGQHSALMTHDIPWGSRSARRGRGTSARQCGRRSAAHRTASDAAPATPSPPSPSCSPAVLFMSPLISVVVPNLLVDGAALFCPMLFDLYIVWTSKLRSCGVSFQCSPGLLAPEAHRGVLSQRPAMQQEITKPPTRRWFLRRSA